jgi:peptidoglycan/LPS O-acetylase OafA/YrhL
LTELQAGYPQKCLSRLASSTFRRPVRLFGPPLLASLIVLLCVRLGFYTPGGRTYPVWINFGFPEHRPPVLETTWEQLKHWYQVTSILLSVFSFNTYLDYPYDGHLWTIPVEFRYSLIVFLLVSAISKTRMTYRIGLLALVVVYCIWAESWEGVLFISGVLLAQLTLVRESRAWKSAPVDDEAVCFLAEEKDLVASAKRRPSFIALALFPVALYLASAPGSNRKQLGAQVKVSRRLTYMTEQYTPGYSFLYDYFTPPLVRCSISFSTSSDTGIVSGWVIVSDF